MCSAIASRRVTRSHGGSRSSVAPSRSIVVRAEHLPGRRGDEFLEPARGVLVVGVGLVPLEHRELGVVLRRDALVAEVLAELVDAVDPADDAALQIELGGDPQVEVAIERVVVSRERARQRAAVQRLQDRGLDLDEAVLVERPADLGDRRRPQLEALEHLRVGDQVELAVAEAELDVGEARVLVGERAQRLRQRVPGLQPQAELAAPALEGEPLDADEVADVGVDEELVLVVAEDVGAGVELDLPGAVAKVDERRLAVAALGDDPAGDEVPRLGLLAVAEPLVRRAHVGDRFAARVAGRIGVEPLLPQALELAAALGDQRRLLGRGPAADRLRRSSGAERSQCVRRSVASLPG